MFNLEECMSNEFLKPRENRCKWFNKFGVEGKGVYIVKGKKTQFSYQNNRLNWFIKCLNQFRQLKTEQRTKKNETIQCVYESIQVNLGWRWIDSNCLWIDSSADQRVLWDASIYKWDDSSMNRFKRVWID